MENRKIKLYVISLIYFLFSVLVFNYFDGGDQKSYREFYIEVGQYDLVDAFSYYLGKLGTSEPVYFIVVYGLSSFFSKDILFSLINAIFIYKLYDFFLEKKVAGIVQVLLAFNFYLLVLLFSAERLKLSLLFIIISFGYSLFLRIIFQSLAFFTHVQTLLMIAQPYVFKFVFSWRKIIFKAKGLISLVVFIMFFSIIVYVMKDHILGKLEYYRGDLFSMIKPLIFMFFSMMCARKNILVPFFQSLIFVVSSYFVGEERIAIFSYIVFIYYGLQYKGGKNIYVLSSSVYFLFKGVIFLYNIFNFGDGFDPDSYMQ